VAFFVTKKKEERKILEKKPRSKLLQFSQLTPSKQSRPRTGQKITVRVAAGGQKGNLNNSGVNSVLGQKYCYCTVVAPN
jgi:hypothetical protein